MRRKDLAPLAHPNIVLREEFDDWAVLHDPDTGAVYGLNPVGVAIWRRCDGRHRLADLATLVASEFQGAPGDVEGDVQDFVESLAENGLLALSAGPAE